MTAVKSYAATYTTPWMTKKTKAEVKRLAKRVVKTIKRDNPSSKLPVSFSKITRLYRESH